MKIMTRQFNTLLLSQLLLMLLLTGCFLDNKAKATRTYIQDVYARKAVPIEPIPSLPAEERFIYKATTLRSPFVPSEPKTGLVAKNSLHPDVEREKEPLEAFPLDSLKIVGIMEIGHNPWALISAPDKTIYRVRIGNYLGQDYGKIIAIDKQAVNVEETISDGDGGWRHQSRLLSIADASSQ